LELHSIILCAFALFASLRLSRSAAQFAFTRRASVFPAPQQRGFFSAISAFHGDFLFHRAAARDSIVQ